MSVLICKGFNDVSLHSAIAIYTYWQGYEQRYYVEVLENGTEVFRPIDENDLNALKKVFGKIETQYDDIYSIGRILLFRPLTHTIAWKTNEKHFHFLHDEKQYWFPGECMLWVYKKKTLYLLLYNTWEGIKTKVMPAPLPNIMADGSICKGNVSFPILNGDIDKFCDETENTYANALKSEPYEKNLKEWQKKYKSKITKQAKTSLHKFIG